MKIVRKGGYHLVESMGGSQQLWLPAKYNAQAPPAAIANEVFDLLRQVMGDEANMRNTCASHGRKGVTEHWMAIYGQKRFGDLVGIRP